MLMESILAVGIISFLAIIHVTDSAEEVVTPFTDAAIRLWHFGIDFIASRAKFFGTLIIEAIGNTFAAILSIAAGLVWEFLVWLREKTVYVVRTQGPVVFGKIQEYANRTFHWSAETFRMLIEELWKLMVMGKERTQEVIEEALQ